MIVSDRSILTFALINMAALTLALCSGSLFADTMASDFFSVYVQDFSSFSCAHGMTPEKQHKLLERRIGTYETDISECDSGFSLPGKKLVRLFVDISSNCTAKLFFEDDSGNYVTRADFLSGKLSDTSIYWGHPEHGVAAIYGIMGDTMPMLVSPHQRQLPLILKRIDARIDASNVRQEPSVSALFASNRDAIDIFSRVCENDSDAEAMRQESFGMDKPGELKMVACYEERDRYNSKRGTWVCAGRSEARRYRVLMNDGGDHIIVQQDNCGYRFEPCYTFPWCNEFRSVFPCDRIEFYLVNDDTLIETKTCFQYLRDLDGCILRPRLYQKMQGLNGLPLDKWIEGTIDELTRNPERFFTRRIWTRVANTPKNNELRHKLYSTYVAFFNGNEGK